MADEPIQTPAPQPSAEDALSLDYDADDRHAPPDEPAPPAPAKAKPKLTSRMVAMARDLGVSEEDISASSQEELERTVFYLNRQVLAGAQEQARLRAHRDAVPSPAPPPPPDDEGPDWGKDEAGKAYTEADYLPGVAKSIKDAASLRKELKEMKARMDALGQRDQAREALSRAEMFDAAFDALGPDYEKFFGKGSGADMRPDSPEMKRRVAALLSAGAANVQTHAALRKALREAVEVLYGPLTEKKPPDPYAAVTEPEAAKPAAETPAQEAWRNGAVARPTQRKGAQEPAGRAKAEKAVEKLMKEFGGAQDTAVADEFPD